MHSINSKDIDIQKIYILKVLLNFSKYPETVSFQKKYETATVFDIDNNQKCFLSRRCDTEDLSKDMEFCFTLQEYITF